MRRLLTAVEWALAPAIVRRVKLRRLAYLDVAALRDLQDAVVDIERRGVAGDLVEAGCALGGSAIVMASAKGAKRSLYVYDAFGLIPPPTDADGPDAHERYAVITSGNSPGLRGDTYYGYQPDLLSKVIGNFRSFGLEPDQHCVTFIPGLFEDTFRPTEPVALAHIDADWYESVKTCLTRLSSVVVQGGRVVIDDYEWWSGCRRAVDEFLASAAGWKAEKRARLHLVKT